MVATSWTFVNSFVSGSWIFGTPPLGSEPIACFQWWRLSVEIEITPRGGTRPTGGAGLCPHRAASTDNDQMHRISRAGASVPGFLADPPNYASIALRYGQTNVSFQESRRAECPVGWRLHPLAGETDRNEKIDSGDLEGERGPAARGLPLPVHGRWRMARRSRKHTAGLQPVRVGKRRSESHLTAGAISSPDSLRGVPGPMYGPAPGLRLWLGGIRGALPHSRPLLFRCLLSRRFVGFGLDRGSAAA